MADGECLDQIRGLASPCLGDRQQRREQGRRGVTLERAEGRVVVVQHVAGDPVDEGSVSGAGGDRGADRSRRTVPRAP